MQKVKYKNKIFLGKNVEVESRKSIILYRVYMVCRMSYFAEFNLTRVVTLGFCRAEGVF